MSVRVFGTIETLPPDASGPGPERQEAQVEASARTYQEALEQVQAQIPEGWRVMAWRVERPA